MTMSAADIMLAVTVMALWGFNFAAAKLATAAFPPIFLMALRFSLVAVLLMPFAGVPRGRLKGIAVLSVILGTGHFPLMFSGLAGIDAATASIVAQLQVPFSSLLAAVFLNDRPGVRGVLGMLVAFAGIVVIAGAPRLDGNLSHLAMIVAASFAFAVSSVQIKRIGAVGGFTLNAWMALFATPQLLVLSLLLETGQREALAGAGSVAWIALAYLVVAATIVAYGLWYRLVRAYPVTLTMPFLLLVPVFGVLSGVVILGEPLTPHLMVGGGMTIAGIGLILARRPPPLDEPASSPT
jgi:O-acetylserine/cysteine efflux transporter